MPLKVAVVILNWNGQKLLERFLPSVVEHSLEATIYVADNASTDDSISFVGKHFPSVVIIKNTTNGGYAKGYNDALQHVSEELFVLLNSDVEVTPSWLTPIVSKFEQDQNLVAAQPKILDATNKSVFEYAGAGGGYLDSLGYPYCRGRMFSTLEEDTGQYDDDTEIFWATGACLFVRRKDFMEIEGFDEDFFAHQEEIDLCWRLRNKGGTIAYVGSSAVYHLGGATLSAANPKKTFYNFRNTLLLIVKNVKGFYAWRLIGSRLILDGLAGVLFLTQGKWSHFVAIIKAHLSFYTLLPTFIKKRKKWSNSLHFYRHKNIVYQYFILKRKQFDKLQ